MAILTPVVSKFNIASGNVQEIYALPVGKTHAFVDVTFFKDDTSQDSLVAIALSQNPNPNNLTTVDYFIDDIQLVGTVNNAELSKVIVGQNERLYVKVLSGPAVNVRVAAMEENNSKVLKAGRLSASNISNANTITKVFENTLTGVSYIAASVTLFNTSTTDVLFEAWVGSNEPPVANEKILEFTVPGNDTTIIENITLLPNEKIFVRSQQPNTEFFINGILVSV